MVNTTPSGNAAAAREIIQKVKFGRDDTFFRDVKARVDRYFRLTRKSPRDNWRMYQKTGIIAAWAVASYVLLVFVASAWWMALPLALSLALALAAVGFNIQHDGGHKAYSKHKWVNKLSAMSLDLLGGSSFMWDHKHNSLHHTYANIDGHDDDIDVGIFGRFSPQQRRLWFHRAQQYYVWFLYGMLPMKWHFYDDFRALATAKIGEHRFARPKKLDLAVFFGGKLLFLALAFAIPILVGHPWWLVILAYLGICFLHGIVLSVVFQLAHVVEHAAFPQPDPAEGRMEHHWAVHQIVTTVNFSRRNPLITWFVGGLNYQIEHHLFPRICHIHYPRISKLVERTCRRHGIQYNVHPSVFNGIASHYRWLRLMGRRTRPA